MKAYLVLIGATVFIGGCGTVTKNHTGEPNSTRFNSGTIPTLAKSSSDTILITGSQYLKILGRNENGMYPDLEGSWVLTAMPGGDLTTKETLIKDVASEKAEKGKPYSGNVLSESMKGSTETGRTVTKTKKGDSTIKETTVYLVNKSNPAPGITPPQGTNYHIPGRPELHLYGSNETFSGFTGCNKIAGRYVISADGGISFHHSAPSTRMVCIGDYDEQAFINTLKRVNRYKATGNQLQLLHDNDVVIVFEKK